MRLLTVIYSRNNLLVFVILMASFILSCNAAPTASQPPSITPEMATPAIHKDDIQKNTKNMPDYGIKSNGGDNPDRAYTHLKSTENNLPDHNNRTATTSTISPADKITKPKQVIFNKFMTVSSTISSSMNIPSSSSISAVDRSNEGREEHPKEDDSHDDDDVTTFPPSINVRSSSYAASTMTGHKVDANQINSVQIETTTAATAIKTSAPTKTITTTTPTIKIIEETLVETSTLVFRASPPTKATQENGKTINVNNGLLLSTLSADPYFISGLSDLSMENREFDQTSKDAGVGRPDGGGGDDAEVGRVNGDDIAASNGHGYRNKINAFSSPSPLNDQHHLITGHIHGATVREGLIKSVQEALLLESSLSPPQTDDKVLLEAQNIDGKIIGNTRRDMKINDFDEISVTGTASTTSFPTENIIQKATTVSASKAGYDGDDDDGNTDAGVDGENQYKKEDDNAHHGKNDSLARTIESDTDIVTHLTTTPENVVNTHGEQKGTTVVVPTKASIQPNNINSNAGGGSHTKKYINGGKHTKKKMSRDGVNKHNNNNKKTNSNKSTGFLSQQPTLSAPSSQQPAHISSKFESQSSLPTHPQPVHTIMASEIPSSISPQIMELSDELSPSLAYPQDMIDDKVAITVVQNGSGGTSGVTIEMSTIVDDSSSSIHFTQNSIHANGLDTFTTAATTILTPLTTPTTYDGISPASVLETSISEDAIVVAHITPETIEMEVLPAFSTSPAASSSSTTTPNTTNITTITIAPTEHRLASTAFDANNDKIIENVTADKEDDNNFLLVEIVDNINGTSTTLAPMNESIHIAVISTSESINLNMAVEVETENSLDNLQYKNDTYHQWREKLFRGGNYDKNMNSSVSSTSSSSTTTPDDSSSTTAEENFDDDIFDVVIDDTRLHSNTNSTDVPDKSIDKLLEADSEEFFVPEDIKERETTTQRPATTFTEILPTTTTRPTIPDGDPEDEQKHRPSTINHEADTIFYISNTEVKVVESVPTPNTNQESQFFPAVYEEDVIIDFSSKNYSGWGSLPDKYEEDIILSPLKNNFDPTKINDENLSISYIGESFIEVKEFTSSADSVTNIPAMSDDNIAISSDVIIQPVQLIPSSVDQQSSQAIGVPVIAELPPQIDIKQIGSADYNMYQSAMGKAHHRMKESYLGSVVVTNNDENSLRTRTMVTEDNGLIQNSFQKNRLSAELPLLMDEANNMEIDNGGGSNINVINGKSVPAKRNKGQQQQQQQQQQPLNSTVVVPLVNATAYSVLDDEPESSEYIFLGFNDIQTLFLACMATLVPLILCVLLAFGVRYFWRKYRQDHATSNGIIGDNSTDPLAVKSRTVSADELKSTESGYSINRSNDTLDTNAEMLSSKLDGSMANKTNHSGANGSVITMTLKNNHLIVETEERNDMARDARETKMHYSPSEKDGVFVVEVARGADSNTIPCNGKVSSEKLIIPNNKKEELETHKSGSNKKIITRDDATLLNNEDVQVHQPPPDGQSDDELLMVDEDGAVSMSSPKLNGDDSMRPICGSSNTGLSQSDLSITSSCGSNQGYCYGSLQHYTVDTRGYQSSSPHINNDIQTMRSTDDCSMPKSNSKPIITAAIYKQESVDPATSYPEDGRPGKLRTDKNASKPSIPLSSEQQQNNTQPVRNKEDTLIEEQRLLGNGSLSAIHETSSLDEKTEPSSPAKNGDAIVSESGPFDSLINLPEPPSVDEMKQLNDITLLDNNNMDSLPPPPPPEVVLDGPVNGGS